MTLQFHTDEGSGQRARLGLVVLQSDETIEAEFARLPTELNNVLVHQTRIPSATNVNHESLLAQHAHLADVVNLFPHHVQFDAIGYGCTSGSTVIGEASVEQAVQSVKPGVPVTNPLTALKAACASLQIKRLGLITPYNRQVTSDLENALTAHGIEIAGIATFDQEEEAVVARIDAPSILNALTAQSDVSCDAWFVSCTNLRMAAITDQAEHLMNRPVLSSNQVLAWHMLRLAGVTDALTNWGRLWHHKLIDNQN